MPLVFFSICTKFGSWYPANSEGQGQLYHDVGNCPCARATSDFRFTQFSVSASIFAKIEARTPYRICKTNFVAERKRKLLPVQSNVFVLFTNGIGQTPSSTECTGSCCSSNSSSMKCHDKPLMEMMKFGAVCWAVWSTISTLFVRDT